MDLFAAVEEKREKVVLTRSQLFRKLMAGTGLLQVVVVDNEEAGVNVARASRLSNTEFVHRLESVCARVWCYTFAVTCFLFYLYLIVQHRR
jgi:hypothetical protein